MINKIKLGLLTCCVLLIPVHLQATNQQVIATIPVGTNPNGIAITPDNKFAYIANNNNIGNPGADTVSVLDLSTNTVLTTISDASFNAPYTVTINPAGTKAYVTNSGGSTVTIIDIATNTVTGTIIGFDGPSGLVINPANTAIAYVNNYGGPILGSGNGYTLSVVNLNSNTIVSTITLGSPPPPPIAPAALAITPNGAFLYSANYVDGNTGTGTVSVINTNSNTVISTIHGFSGPFNIVITPDGKYAYITNFGSNNFSPVGTTVSVINLSTNQIQTTINVGIQPAGIALTPNGLFAYVTNYNTLYLGSNFTDLTPGVGTINVINIATNQVIPNVTVVGASPANIAISPDGTRAYVTNYSSNSASVITDQMWLNTYQ